DETNYQCPNGHPYFNNPRVAATVVFRDGKGELLFTKRAGEPYQGKYDLPGGFAQFGEEPHATARREMQEELGLTINSEDLELIGSALHAYEENDNVCSFIFLCHKWSGQPHTGDDAASYAWKPLSFLKSDELAWRYDDLYDKLSRRTPVKAGYTEAESVKILL